MLTMHHMHTAHCTSHSSRHVRRHGRRRPPELFPKCEKCQCHHAPLVPIVIMKQVALTMDDTCHMVMTQTGKSMAQEFLIKHCPHLDKDNDMHLMQTLEKMM